MGLAYYQLTPEKLLELRPLITAHEAEPVGPRARGYWFDRPDEYDYEGVRATAQKLDAAGRANALESLEISENQAHALSLLDIELPRDDADFAPSLFAVSVDPAMLRRHMRIAYRRLGTDPEKIVNDFVVQETDTRFRGYLSKQVRHLREVLPSIWRFYERALASEKGILVVDLRARDLEIPDEVELIGM